MHSFILCFNRCSSSIEKMNRLIIINGISNICYQDQLTFSKLRFSRKENLKKCTSFEEQKSILIKKIWWNVLALKSKKVQSIFGEPFILALSSSAVFYLKAMSQISFNLFCSGDKGLISEIFGYEVDFTNIMNVSQISWLKIKISKNWDSFVHERAMITTTLISSCHWEILVPFLLAKEKTWKCVFNTNSGLLQNQTEKQIMPFKTTVNWLFRPHVADLFFIVTFAHQKIKALFCHFNFDYMANFVEKSFVFLFFYFEYNKRKEKYMLNSIVLQNLLNYSNVFYKPMNRPSHTYRFIMSGIHSWIKM